MSDLPAPVAFRRFPDAFPAGAGPLSKTVTLPKRHVSALSVSICRLRAILKLSWMLFAGLCFLSFSAAAQEGVEELFAVIAREIPATELRLLANLNDREEAAGRPEPPRLGGFADLPPDEYPDSAEIEAWEAAALAGEIGGLIMFSDRETLPPVSEGYVRRDHSWHPRNVLDRWTSIYEFIKGRERIFVTFASEDLELADRILEVAAANNYRALSYRFTFAYSDESDRIREVPEAAEFYATAQYRLALDTRQARRLRTDVTELELLGERARRNSDSVYRDPANRDVRGLSRNEPEVFRKITLGDEFTQPTIEEIIVPGGIALGESADLDAAPDALIFENGGFTLLQDFDGRTGGTYRRLPAEDPKTLKALFDLTRRSIRTRSDAIVDLDAESRVRISSALRDTDAGYDMLFADTQPFAFLDYLPVTKSVIIDTETSWHGEPGVGGRAHLRGESPVLQFTTGFEVRFLSANRMRIAQTRLALEYNYDSRTGAVSYGGNWGRDASRLRESTDVDALGEALGNLVHYAGWVALFRYLEEENAPFLGGRYEFMKIDKEGRETPRRFR